MRRREFLLLLGGAVAGVPKASAQQPAGHTHRIGYLLTSTREQQLHLSKAFEDGLRALGYRIGENVVIEYRFANAEMDRLPALAAELARLRVDIIVTGNNANVMAAMDATKTIPIVMTNSFSPVSAGLIRSLARPGGNVTGLTADTGDEINGKRLELLKDTIPALSRVAMLLNPDFAPNQGRFKSTQEAAKTLGMTLVSVEARGQDALEEAFATMVKERAQAVVVAGDPVLFNFRNQIGAMALRNRLPGISNGRDYTEAGLLLSYGVDNRDLWRRSANFVNKILKGAKPADLPVEQPIKFEMVINLKTARALGIDVPLRLQQIADEVIE